MRTKEEIAAYQKRYNQEHAEERRRYRIENKEGKHNRHLKRLYGITREDYLRMLEQQGGVCAICGGGNGDRYFHVDHDHRSGKIRGLLCNDCNLILGNADDNTSILERAIQYLARRK